MSVAMEELKKELDKLMRTAVGTSWASYQTDEIIKIFIKWLDKPRCKECGDVLWELEARQK